MLRSTGCALLFSAFAVLPAQHVLSEGKPAAAGMSARRLAVAAKLYEDIVARDDLRGVVLLVARRGKIVLHEAYGWRDAAKKKPMRKDSLFRMASNSKAVTATGILILADEKKLKLSDPVYVHLPAWKSERGAAITIEQLLTHTSGLRIKPIFIRPLLKKSAANPDAPGLLAEIRRFGSIGAAVEPNTTWSYSNAGYNTLAALVEVVSGKPYKEFLRSRIYEPLGMKDSCNHESDADHERMSAIFRRKGAKKAWQAGWRPGDRPDYPFPRGSGGMIATARDYAVLCRMYLNGGVYGKRRILSARITRAAIRSQTSHIAAGVEYGYGWRVSTEAGRFFHGGSDGTWSWCDTKRQIIGLVFTQSPRGGVNPKEEFRDLVTAACRNQR